MNELPIVTFLAALVMAGIWTFLFYRIAYPPKRTPRTGKCSHAWKQIEDYDNGTAKARCTRCGQVSLVSVPCKKPH